MNRKKYSVTLQKKHEGKTLYAYPTGSGCNHRTDNKLATVKVIKVKRKYAHLEISGRKAGDFCLKTGITQEGYGYGGYRWYESAEDHEKDVEMTRKIRAIETHTRQFNWASKLSVDQTNTLYNALIEVDTDGN